MRPGRTRGTHSEPESGANQIWPGLSHTSPSVYSVEKYFGQLTSLTVSVHSRTGALRFIFTCMYFIPDKCSDFSVVIKIRGKPPSPWKWEIYRAGHSRAVAQSAEFFSTVSAAKKAGDRALAELFENHLIS